MISPSPYPAQRRPIRGTFLLVVALCFAATTYGQEKQPVITDELTFKADYTEADRAVTPDISAGSAQATVHLEKKPLFDFDTMAHTIWGLSIGEGAASVGYESADNLPKAKGSLEFTLKPQDWRGDDAKAHMFLQTVVSGRTPLGKLFIYKYKTSGLAVHFEYSASGDRIFLHEKIPQWTAGSWHHVAVTYDLPGAVRLYIDGRLVDDAQVPAVPEWPKRFSVGPAGAFGRDGRTTVGILAAYSRVLTDTEIRALARHRLPGLAMSPDGDDSPTVAKRITGKRSPWHTSGRPALAMDALDPNAVPEPWEAIRTKQDTVSVWGREYTFGEEGMVSRIASGGSELLAAPIRLETTASEKRCPIIFEPGVAITRQAAGKVDVVRKSPEDAEYTAQLECRIAYDGLVWCTAAIELPADLQPSSLEMIVPLTAETAQFIHYVGAPHEYESQDLPKHSYSRALPAAPGTVFTSGFRTTVWIGNNRRGLLWCAESDQYWWPKDRPDAIRVVRKDDGRADLVLNVVSEVLPATAGRIEFRFGLMATPVKPMPGAWRDWTFTAQYDSYKGRDRGTHLIYWPDQWRFMKLDPEPHRARDLATNRARLAADHADGRLIMPYWTRLHAVGRDGEKIEPDASYMYENWRTAPNRPGGGKHQIFRCDTTTGWGDYLVWCVREWANVMGHIDGVYIDETQPIPNLRETSNGGYLALDGMRRPTFEFFGSRRVYQRMVQLITERNGTPATAVAHCSATHTMQCLSPFAVMLIGEQYFSGYFRENPELLPPEEDRTYYYSYALPMDRLRAECFWRQWGEVMLWLPCLKNQKDIITNPATTRDMLSRVMQADMLVWPLFCNSEEVRKTWRFRREFGIGGADTEFVPYWDNVEHKPDVEQAAVGYYRKLGARLLIVSNLDRKRREVRIPVPADVVEKVSNAETGDEIPVTDGRITLTLPRNDYRAVLLQTRDALAP